MPALILNPGADGAFVEVARRLLRETSTDLAEYQAALRLAYPNATVRDRSLSGELGRTWYVYRDGRWTGPDTAEGHQPDETR